MFAGVELDSGDQAFDTLPAYFQANFEPALDQLLAAAGEIRDGLAPYGLLRAAANLSVSSGEDGHTGRMLDLMIDGLRYGAKAAAVGEGIGDGVQAPALVGP